MAAPWPAARAAEEGRKVRVRLAFSHTTPDRITWPNIGYDYEGRGRQVAEQLRAMCPGLEFLPVHITNAEQAGQVWAADKEVDGYLLYVLGMQGGGGALSDAAGKAGRPMLVVEDQYAGPFSLGFNSRAEKAGWKALALATTRMDDVGAAARCFEVLRKAGATADDFLSAARAAYKKAVGPKGDMACTADAVKMNDLAKCIERLRASTILLVGRDVGTAGQPIQQEYGAKVVSIKHAELHDAFLKADAAEAQRWADQWLKGAEKTIEPTREEVVKSGALHVAMLALMKKYDARAITINCLGGFYSGALQAFPCLGFVEMNNGGLVGGCEGDLQSAITMLAIGDLVGRPGYISDPVIDLANHRIIYAHCVAPTKVFGPQGPSNPYHVRSHSEDHKGAAVRSLLPLGYLTSTMKIIPGQKRILFHQGKAVDNIDEDKACRTKLACEVKGDVDRLFSNWGAGWHRVTFYGDLRGPVEEFCKALGVSLVEEA